MALAGTVVDAYNTARKNITRDIAIMLPASEVQMDEDDVLRNLLDEGFNRRSEILEKLRKNVRISNALQFSNKASFFGALNRALSDTNWDVRHQCILLLAEVVPLLRSEVDDCMSVVLVKLISCIGDSKLTVRRGVIQALHVYMKHTTNLSQFIRNLVSLGLDSVDPKVRKEVVVSLPMLLTSEFALENYVDMIASLCHKLEGGMRPEDEGVQKLALTTLDKLHDLVGEARFRSQLASCAPLVRDCYCRAVTTGFDADAGPESSFMNVTEREDETMNWADELELGVLPAGLLAQLSADRDDFRARAQATERLKEALERLPRGGGAAAPHLAAIFALVGGLLDDTNFRVVTLALDALSVLLDRVGREARSHVKLIVAALTHRMGDNKAVVRASVARAALQLMQSLGPQLVLLMLADNLVHRNSRVRAETLNLVIAALLTFPSTDFDLPAVCASAACCLADARRAVRHAALECVAVLAQCLGAVRAQPLSRAVDAVELHYDGAGVATAVAARLSRRVLPRRDADGLVEYALQLPAGGRGSGLSGGVSTAMPPGADTDWILAGSGAGSGGGSSARSIRLEDLEVVAPPPPVDGSPASKKQAAASGGSRPTARSRLPWGDGAENGGHSSLATSNVQAASNGFSTSSSIGAAAKQTWADGGQGGAASTEPGLTKKLGRKPSSGALSDLGGGAVYNNGATGVDATADEFFRGDDHGAPAPLKPSPAVPPTVARPAFSKAPAKGAVDGGSAASAPGVAAAAAVSPNVVTSTSRPPPDIRGDLSSSWPGNKRGGSGDDGGGGGGTLGRRPFLDPISAPDTPVPVPQPPPAWSGNDSEERRGRGGSKDATEDTPVHVKPKLVRSASRGRAGAAKVPPIQPLPPERSISPRRDGGGGFDDSDSAYGTIDMDEGGDGQEGLMSSLNRIRHSASKKKAEKLFRKLELKQSINGGQEVPLISSSPTAIQSPEPASTATQSSTRGNPFEAKPKLARRTSQGRAAATALDSEELGGGSVAGGEGVKAEYNPLAGVTFRRGGQSDVSVVGRGYVEDAAMADPRPGAMHPSQKGAREKRRVAGIGGAGSGGKGSRLSPLGVASLNGVGAVPQTDEEFVTVIGHGVFEGGHLGDASQPGAAATTRSLAAVASGLKSTDPGLIPVRAMAAMKLSPSHGGGDSDPGEETSEEVLIAPTLRDQMAARRREKAEEAAAQRRRKQQEQEHEERLAAIEAERRRAEQEQATERRRKEQEQAAEKRRKQLADRKHALLAAASSSGGEDAAATGDTAAAFGLGGSEDEGLLVAGVSQSKPPTGKRQPPPPARRRTVSPAGGTGIAPPFSAGSGEQLTPLNDPEAALRDAYHLIADDDWNAKYNGIMSVRRLVAYHEDVLAEHAHSITVAMVKEVQNLRSQVARLAIVALGDLFSRLKRTMDSELDIAAKALLHKNGESNEFIRAELEKSLRVMVDETTPQRALTAVINGGASHKNAAVRRVVVQLLDGLTEKLGSDRILSGAKDITDRLLPAVANLATDASPETRWYSRKILLYLMEHPDFDKCVVKFIPAASHRNVKDVCEALRSKGLGDMPQDTPSAKGRRSGIMSRSRTSSSDSIPVLGSDGASSSGGSSKAPPAVRKALFRPGDDETVKQLCATLTASDWQQRYDGVDELADMCESHSNLVSSHIVRIFDKFIPLLRDSNSKVNLHALQTLNARMLVPLAASMGQVTSLAVQTATANLASKNKEVCAAAGELLDAFIEHLDNAQLMQPFANQALVSTVKIKPVLVDRVSYLVERVYARKPKHVVLHVLPLLWHLLGVAGAAGSAVRTSTGSLVATLHRMMGGALVDEAAGNSLVSAACVRLLRDMIEEGTNGGGGSTFRATT